MFCFANFVHSHFPLLFLAELLVTTVSVWHSYFLFPSVSLLLMGLRELWLRTVLLLLSFFDPFFFFFFAFWFCFPLFFVFGNFIAPDYLLAFTFLLVVSCAHVRHNIYGCMGGTWTPLASPPFPKKFCDTHVATTSSFWPVPPPYITSHNMSCLTTNHSFCLVFCLLRAHASPYTHPNSSPPSWVPYYPFMHRCTFLCFAGKFPGHTWSKNIPSQPICVFAYRVFLFLRVP